MKHKLIKSIAVTLMVSSLWGANLLAAPEAVKLNLFYYKQEIVNQMKDLTEAFTKKNPQIKIELEIVPNDSMTVLRTKMASGQAPDLIQLQSYANVFEFAQSGWLLDLSKEPILNKVMPGAKNAVTYPAWGENKAIRGKVYALPMDLAGIGIIYNKEIFNKYGLKPPKTFKELKVVSATLKKNKVTPFASMFKANWSLGHFFTMAHTTLAGAKLNPWLQKMNANQASYADPVEVKSLFKMLDFYKANSDPRAAEFDWNEQQAAFAKGEAAMMVQGLWSYGAAIATNPKLKCGFIPFPCTDNVTQNKMYADVDSTFAISASSSPERIKAAKIFLEWLATPEAIKIWVEKCKLVPTFKGANLKAMDAPFQDLVSYMNRNQTNPWAFSMYPVTVFEDACKNGAQEYMFGRKNATQVIQYIDQTWKKN